MNFCVLSHLVLFSTNVSLSLFNATSIDGHALLRMESLASIQSLMSFTAITLPMMFMENETSERNGIGEGSESNSFHFDDLPSLDE